MTRRSFLAALALGCCVAGALAAPPARVLRVACVGDSITQGDSAGPGNSYPEQLSRLLGMGWEVGNFGVNGATINRAGDRPYVAQSRAAEALAWSPDVVVVLLGTNDSKARNWQGPERLGEDLGRLLAQFAQLPSRPRLIVCRPITVIAPGKYGITPEGVAEVRSAIDRVVAAANWEVLDLSTVLATAPEHLPDSVHPNAHGAGRIAAAVRAAILRESGRR